MGKKRSITMDIAKGLGITAVVAGHSNGPDRLTRFLYLFHLPLFFFISGYFWKDEYLDDLFTFFKKKVKELYIPFVELQIVFIMLNNLFFKIYFYSSNGEYTTPQFAQLPLDIKGVITKINSVLLFGGNGDMFLGAAWFLIVLFFMFMLFAAISYATKKKPEYYRAAAVAAIFFYGFFLVQHKLYLERNFHTGLIALGVFYLGFLFKKYGQKIPISLPYSIVALLVMYLAASKFHIAVEMARNIYPNPFAFLLVALAGIYLTLFASHTIKNFTLPANILAFVGRNTLPILFLHFLAFRAVNLAVILYKHYPIQWIARFPTIYYTYSYTNWLWIAYVAVGIALPIGAAVVYRIGKDYLKSVDYQKLIKAQAEKNLVKVK